MTIRGEEKVAVLCDFDGTATLVDVTDTLYLEFGDEVCHATLERWIKGEITTPRELEICFSRMYPRKQEMEAFIDTVPLDPGFADLVSLCRQRGYDFAVLSDGLRWYIDRILERHGFDQLTVYANEIEFLEDGVELSFPWYDPGTPMRGTSKPSIVRRYQREGCDVVFIGDGLSDTEVAGVADVLYAKERLLDHCLEHDIPAASFANLEDVVENWQDPSGG
ncbi:MAG: MtnX-like HAD-IB family phosphatase [Anaerolineae bacterium]|jgi:2,3-diketo-5-methylthio-1-phosphopentane phosphatase